MVKQMKIGHEGQWQGQWTSDFSEDTTFDRERRPILVLISALLVSAIALLSAWGGSQVYSSLAGQTGSTPYPASEMPSIMADDLNGVVEGKGLTATNPGFFAGDQGFSPLQPDAYGSASFMYADVSSGNHTWRLYVGKGIDGRPSVETGCPSMAALLSCQITPNPDGSLTDSRVTIAVFNDSIQNWQEVDPASLTADDLKNTRVERDLSVYRGDNKTTVAETIVGFSSKDFDKAFETTEQDWQSVLSDPSLVLEGPAG